MRPRRHTLSLQEQLPILSTHRRSMWSPHNFFPASMVKASRGTLCGMASEIEDQQESRDHVMQESALSEAEYPDGRPPHVYAKDIKGIRFCRPSSRQAARTKDASPAIRNPPNSLQGSQGVLAAGLQSYIRRGSMNTRDVAECHAT